MSQRVVVIDYGSGNLRSAQKALERAGREAGLDRVVEVSAEPDRVAAADRVVLPGVGAFGDCRAGLAAIAGMVDALQRVRRAGRPLLGICVGFQLMAERGLEHGEHPGFGWLGGDVVALAPDPPTLKIPHMGWNQLSLTEAGGRHPVLAGIEAGAHAYFVHSYQLQPSDPSALLASADYGGPIAAVAGSDTVIGTQFHPEKSQAVGLRLLGNFLAWSP